MITTCTTCGQMYEAGSEEQAYEQERFCFVCRFKARLVEKLIEGRFVADADQPQGVGETAERQGNLALPE